MKPTQLLQLLLLGTIWGSSYLLVKVVVDGVDPVTLVGGRIALGAFVLLAILRWRGLTLPGRSRLWLHLAAMAVFGNIVPFVLIAWGEQHIASGLAAILNATTPFFTLLIAVALFGTERFTAGKIGGLLVGFVGVALLTGAGVADLASTSSRGQLALILASACYGLSFAYARRFLRGEPLVVATAQIVVAALLMVPLVLLFGRASELELTPTVIAAWFALGAISSGVAYIIYYQLIGAVGATAASYTTYIIPIVGVFWGSLLLGESFAPRSFAGVGLIFAGLAVATRRRAAPVVPSRIPATAGNATPAADAPPPTSD